MADSTAGACMFDDCFTEAGSGFITKGDGMADRVEVCMCEKCGNEAEMTVTCQWIEAQTSSGETRRKQRETRTCKVCGNEADLIIDFD